MTILARAYAVSGLARHRAEYCGVSRLISRVRIGPPLRDGYDAGRQQIQFAEERGDLVRAAQVVGNRRSFV